MECFVFRQKILRYGKQNHLMIVIGQQWKGVGLDVSGSLLSDVNVQIILSYFWCSQLLEFNSRDWLL